MNDFGISIRCQRCGAQMELHDPEPGQGWAPNQFWICSACGRHFWTTYPPPKPAEPASPAAKPAGDKPT